MQRAVPYLSALHLSLSLSFRLVLRLPGCVPSEAGGVQRVGRLKLPAARYDDLGVRPRPAEQKRLVPVVLRRRLLRRPVRGLPGGKAMRFAPCAMRHAPCAMRFAPVGARRSPGGCARAACDEVAVSAIVHSPSLSLSRRVSSRRASQVAWDGVNGSTFTLSTVEGAGHEVSASRRECDVGPLPRRKLQPQKLM